MAEGYGSILTGAQAAQQIAKFDRDKQNRLTWQNLLQSNDLAAGKAVQDLEVVMHRRLWMHTPRTLLTKPLSRTAML